VKGFDLLVRPPAYLDKEEVDPAVIAKLAREIRELATLRVGFEVVVDANVGHGRERPLNG
jgi:hypothetical protein